MEKNGLVLEGGAMRGFFSAGVMDVMMENGVEFDGIIGVSAGAAFGCNYKSRQPGRAIRYNMKYAKDWRYCSVRSLIVTGDIFGGEFDYHYLPTHLDIFDTKAFEENPVEFYAVCTDVETGKPVYKKLDKCSYECYEWIRASASMPLASKIVEIGNRKLLDGGISDSIPLSYFQSIGYGRNIVVTTQPQEYVKGKNWLMPLIRYSMRKFPHFIEACANRHLMYNQQLAYLKEEEKKGTTLVIRPDSKLEIGHISHNPDEMKATYEIGRKAAEQRLGEILDFIAAGKE